MRHRRVRVALFVSIAAASACASRVTVFDRDAVHSRAPEPCASQAWCWQHPVPAPYGVSRVRVAADGSFAWAVGDRGAAYRWSASTDQWEPRHGDESVDFRELRIDDAGDAWAVGWVQARGEGTSYRYASTLYRHTETGWVVSAPAGLLVDGLSGSSRANLWITASVEGASTIARRAYQRDGSNWALREIPGIAVVHMVCARGADEAWVLGQQSTASTAPSLAHWSSGRWSTRALETSLSSYAGSIACTAPGEVWLSGTRSSEAGRGSLRVTERTEQWLRWDSSGLALDATALVVDSLERPWLSDGERLARWDGTQWSAFEVPSARDGALATLDLSGDLSSGWSVSAHGALLRWRGELRQWQDPAPAPRFSLGVLVGRGAQPSMALGEGSLGWRRGDDGWSFEPLVSATTGGASGPLGEGAFAAAASVEDQTWLVGDYGHVARAHVEGSRVVVETVLERDEAMENDSLRSVWGAQRDAVWAVSTRGLVRRWDGARWGAPEVDAPREVGAAPGTWLRAAVVTGSSARDVWIIGDEVLTSPNSVGDLIARHWDGARWSDERIGRVCPTGRLHGGELSAWAPRAGELWVSAGCLLRRSLDGGWSEPFTDVQSAMRVTGGPDGALYVLSRSPVHGDNGVRATGPDRVTLGPTRQLPRGFGALGALWVGSTGELWIAGAGGAIVRFRP